MRRCKASVTVAWFLLACLASHLLAAAPVPKFGVANGSSPDFPREAVDLSQVQQLQNGLQEGKQELEDLLHWAIEHSDPSELKRRAQAATDPGTLATLQKRVQELSELMHNQNTETQLLQEAITLLNSTDAEAERLQALDDMQYLVEPLDNANDLKTLKGLEPLVHHLRSGSPEVQAAVCHVLGTAASNNPKFQEHLLEQAPGVVQELVQLTQSPSEATAGKALYAAAALVRNSPDARQLFTRANGNAALLDILARAEVSANLQRKALNLVTDLAQLEPEMGVSSPALTAAIQRMLRNSDWDLREKALLAIQTMVNSNPKNAQAFEVQSELQMLQADLKQHRANGSLEPGYHEDLSALLVLVQEQLGASPP